jgi:hypothetical protein
MAHEDRTFVGLIRIGKYRGIMLKQFFYRIVFSECLIGLIFTGHSFAQVHWTQRNPLPMSMNCVTWTGKQLVGIGNGVFLSSNGSNWTTVPGAPAGLASVVWTGSQLIAVGTNGGIYTSPDGTIWTSRNSGTVYDLLSVTWTGNQIVAVGSNGVIVTSSDGTLWVTRIVGSANSLWLYSVTWTGKMLVATGIQLVRTSTDGITWTASDGPTSDIMTFVLQTDSVLVVAGGYNNTAFYTSLSGGHGAIPSGGGYYVSGTWNGKVIVAVGQGVQLRHHRTAFIGQR